MEYFVSGFFAFLSSGIIIVVGVSQLSSNSPVGFFTGDTPLKNEEISNVKAWNRKHGEVMIKYGISIILCWIISVFVNNLAIQLILFPGVLLLELPLLVINHYILVKKYRVNCNN